MKKKILFVSTAVILLAVLGTGTLAYFTAEDVAHNVITTAGVEIALVEQMLDSDGNTIPFENQTGLMPGSTASKIVTVENLAAEAWIRVTVETTVTAEDGSALDADRVVPNFDTTNWLSDGEYYYYTTPVAEGGSTEPLFTEVYFQGKEMDNAYAGCTVSIQIYAQAVQAANNLPDDGSRTLTAANLSQIEGWPSPLEEAIQKILN